MTVILGAMDGEIAATLSGMSASRISTWNGFAIHHGSIEGQEVVVAQTGVGKSLSAMLCQHLIDEYLPQRILFIGVAGSLNPDLTVGDTLIARDCLFHDMDVTPFGFKPGEIPFTPYRILLCDSKLVELSRALPPRAGKALVGRVLTGDQFIASATERARLREEFNGDAVEMEGASVGLVATVNQIPFLLLRTISDEADGKGKKEFHRFLEFASDNAWHYLRGILRTCEV